MPLLKFGQTLLPWSTTRSSPGTTILRDFFISPCFSLTHRWVDFLVVPNSRVLHMSVLPPVSPLLEFSPWVNSPPQSIWKKPFIRSFYWEYLSNAPRMPMLGRGKVDLNILWTHLTSAFTGVACECRGWDRQWRSVQGWGKEEGLAPVHCFDMWAT